MRRANWYRLPRHKNKIHGHKHTLQRRLLALIFFIYDTGTYIEITTFVFGDSSPWRSEKVLSQVLGVGKILDIVPPKDAFFIRLKRFILFYFFILMKYV